MVGLAMVLRVIIYIQIFCPPIVFPPVDLKAQDLIDKN
jgi:hypothetical protein